MFGPPFVGEVVRDGSANVHLHSGPRAAYLVAVRVGAEAREGLAHRLPGGYRTTTRRRSACRAYDRRFREQLAKVIDKNVIYTGRWAEGKNERLPALATELVGLNIDLLVTLGSPAAKAAKEATSTIPIVFVAAGGDAVGTGLVTSLGRPGGTLLVSLIRLPS